MVIIKQSLLERFSKEHAETRKSLATWRQITENAFWENRQDVLRSFPNAKMIKNNRARFEIVHMGLEVRLAPVGRAEEVAGDAEVHRAALLQAAVDRKSVV